MITDTKRFTTRNWEVMTKVQKYILEKEEPQVPSPASPGEGSPHIARPGVRSLMMACHASPVEHLLEGIVGEGGVLGKDLEYKI